jgi:hypothetical protein
VAALKPHKLTISDILEVGGVLVFRRLSLFMRIAAPLILPATALLIALLVAFDLTPRSRATDYLYIGVSVPLIVLNLLALAIAVGGCVKATADLHGEVAPSPRASLAFVRERLSSYLWLVAILLAGIAPGVALYVIARSRENFNPLTIIPILLAFWLASIWSVALPAFFIENLRVVQALERSRALVRGRFAHALGAVVFGSILALFAGVLALIVVSVFTFGSTTVRGAISLAGWTLGELLAVPLLAAYTTVLYYDLRAHQEGLRPRERLDSGAR